MAADCQRVAFCKRLNPNQSRLSQLVLTHFLQRKFALGPSGKDEGKSHNYDHEEANSGRRGDAINVHMCVNRNGTGESMPAPNLDDLDDRAWDTEPIL